MDRFEFNAPQFTDFHSSMDSDDEEAEKYFDVDHECDDSLMTVVSTDQPDDKTDNEVVCKNTEAGEVPKRKRSARSDGQPKKYMCMAEAIEKFQKTTPARFHSRPRNMKVDFKAKKHSPLKCTVPISPHLSVIRRNRPVNALSRQQMEEMEVEEMKKYQIKARPLNEKVFKAPNVDISHRSHVTEVKPFNLTEFKKKPQEPLPRVVKFTARPVPKGLLNKREDKQNVSAPVISVRHRVPVVNQKKEIENTSAKPLRKGPISSHPFSFDERDKMLLKKKQEKIKEAIEDEKKAREFHANPLPKFSSAFQEKPTILPTIPQPFHLSADDRGQAMKEKWEKKVQEERRLMKEAAQFKAKPATVLSQKPFLPSRSEHHSLGIYDIHLNTETRSKERALFDMKIKEKEEYIEKLKMEKQKEFEKRKEEEVAELRKKIVHKANPVRHFKNITIQPSEKPLTLPMTPRSFIEKK